MHISNDLLMGGSPGSAELYMTPIDLEPVEGLGMTGVLDHGGMWDLDGMLWGPSPSPSVHHGHHSTHPDDAVPTVAERIPHQMRNGRRPVRWLMTAETT